ncbi:hypothetical protein [uncultured Anaerobiospirillum sp.]|uniref:hypothetical protein n=1 Tax=uncultured Anaerobiospirillum sp. TaxID=265728 RepID=UPI0028052C21|nr:hypothetical protein [uncultured Anaerobiospirillum sp.]
MRIISCLMEGAAISRLMGIFNLMETAAISRLMGIFNLMEMAAISHHSLHF